MNASLGAYFSHSWKSHLPLHLAMWRRLQRHCHLLIDRPVQETRDSNPPYYISRIESILRRSDVFVACLPRIDPSNRATKSKPKGDWGLNCSPYILFEIRLAERAGLPRFILYDPTTGFKPPDQAQPQTSYIPGPLDKISQQLEQQEEHVTLAELNHWLARLEQNVRPGLEKDHFRWGLLMAKGKEQTTLRGMVTKAVKKVGFDKPVDLMGAFPHDAELLQTLRSLRLLVVDVAAPPVLPLYYMAHALLVPCVRLRSQAAAQLPDLLHGHPAGYQKDLLSAELPGSGNGTAAEKLFTEIRQRAAATAEYANPIIGLEDGNYELQQRGYVRHLVFVSHNLKGESRALVDEICRQCRARAIDVWEYEDRNRAGEDWHKNLDDALARTTHFVALLTPTYQDRPECMKEWNSALDGRKTEKIKLLPFLVEGAPARCSVCAARASCTNHCPAVKPRIKTPAPL